jgi:hypothetical protein
VRRARTGRGRWTRASGKQCQLDFQTVFGHRASAEFFGTADAIGKGVLVHGEAPARFLEAPSARKEGAEGLS